MGRGAVNESQQAYTGNAGRLGMAKVLVRSFCDHCGCDRVKLKKTDEGSCEDSECFRYIRTYNCINNGQGSKHNAFLSHINIVIISVVWRVFSTPPMVSVVMVKTRSKRLHGVPVSCQLLVRLPHKDHLL